MTEKAENTGEKQVAKPKSGQFPKGKSGNPEGRPKGSRNKATLAAEALLDGDGEAITKKAIELAKAGDMAAIRLCLERLVPVRKCRPFKVSLPKIEGPGDILKSVNAVMKAVSKGKITTDEADALMRLIEQGRRAFEIEVLSAELDELHARMEVLSG